jgi:hypothetical protein
MFNWVRPIHIIAVGLLGLLFAGVGSTVLVEEQVQVPANYYVQYTVRVYPGQSIQVAATVHMPEQQEYENNVIEILVMDDVNYGYFESENYDMITERYKQRVDANYWEYLEVDARWFGTIHVVLNNKIRVSDSELAKETSVRVTRLTPLGYLEVPSLVVLIYGAVLWSKEYDRVRREECSTA